jgi:hypothetical protein
MPWAYGFCKFFSIFSTVYNTTCSLFENGLLFWNCLLKLLSLKIEYLRFMAAKYHTPTPEVVNVHEIHHSEDKNIVLISKYS